MKPWTDFSKVRCAHCRRPMVASLNLWIVRFSCCDNDRCRTALRVEWRWGKRLP